GQRGGGDGRQQRDHAGDERGARAQDARHGVPPFRTVWWGVRHRRKERPEAITARLHPTECGALLSRRITLCFSGAITTPTVGISCLTRAQEVPRFAWGIPAV